MPYASLSPENGGSCEVRCRCTSVASFLFGFLSLAEVELVKRSSSNWRAATYRLGAGVHQLPRSSSQLTVTSW
jgi:hypothetical protein